MRIDFACVSPILSPETIMQNYGDNKVFQTARGMAHLSEANGGDRKITGKK